MFFQASSIAKLEVPAFSHKMPQTKNDRAIEFSWIGLGLILEEGEFSTNVAIYDNEMKYLY